MFDKAAQLRLKAEACRRLAELCDDAARAVLWLDRADRWERHKGCQGASAKSRPEEGTGCHRAQILNSSQKMRNDAVVNAGA